MKPDPITKTNFKTIHGVTNWEGLKSQTVENPFSFQEFTVPEPMPQQEVAPPAYMWDRISSVLDAQDRLKAATQVAPAISPAEAKVPNNRKFILYAAVVMLIGAIVLSVI
jgi:hypothetical protein